MGWLSDVFGVGSGDPSNSDRQGVRTGAANLSQTGNNLSDFGDQARAGYGQDTASLASQQQYLQDLMHGKNSVSAEQLRQGLQQQLSQQQAMAASANPNNAAMAARNAALNMGRASYGMSGQAALAGIQERNAAAQSLASLNLGMRGQDLQGTLGGYNGATGAYGASAGAYGSAMQNPQKTWGPIVGGAIGGLASYAAGRGGGLGGGGGAGGGGGGGGLGSLGGGYGLGSAGGQLGGTGWSWG